jgi:hypothetical protein
LGENDPKERLAMTELSEYLDYSSAPDQRTGGVRRIPEQNWFAVGLDLGIVVVGVFIGIQVANWNEARRENAADGVFPESLAVRATHADPCRGRGGAGSGANRNRARAMIVERVVMSDYEVTSERFP